MLQLLPLPFLLCPLQTSGFLPVHKLQHEIPHELTLVNMNQLRGISTIWYRDILRFWHDRMRLIGSLTFPLLFLFVFGSGLSARMGVLGGVHSRLYSHSLQGFHHLRRCLPDPFWPLQWSPGGKSVRSPPGRYRLPAAGRSLLSLSRFLRSGQPHACRRLPCSTPQ